MPLDFRYHIISITAVFMALILGIAIGVAIKRGNYMNTQIAELKDGYKVLDHYKDLDEKNNQLLATLTPNLTKNYLVNRNIVIVYGTTSADNGTTKKLKDSLINAGANVSVEINILPGILDLQENNLHTVKMQSNNSITETVVREMCRSLGTAKSTSILSELKSQKAITYTGDPTKEVGTIIYFGAITLSTDYLQSITLPLIKSSASRGLTVAAVSQTGSTFIPSKIYGKYTDITVDNIDTPAGILALITSLRDNEYGDYGIGKDTNYFVPNIGKMEHK